MSSPTPIRTAPTAVIVGVVVVVCFAIAAVVAITIAAPDGANTGSIITLLLGSLAPTIAALANLAKTEKIQAQVDELSNGLGDAKHRAAIADVVRPEFLRDDAAPLLDQDRARRSRKDTVQ